MRMFLVLSAVFLVLLFPLVLMPVAAVEPSGALAPVVSTVALSLPVMDAASAWLPTVWAICLIACVVILSGRRQLRRVLLAMLCALPSLHRRPLRLGANTQAG